MYIIYFFFDCKITSLLIYKIYNISILMLLFKDIIKIISQNYENYLFLLMNYTLI